MTVQGYRDYIAAGNPVVNGSEAHLFMHKMSQEAIRITMDINNKYHTPEELRKLFSELWDIDVPESFGLFPPFNTDCGKFCSHGLFQLRLHKHNIYIFHL